MFYLLFFQSSTDSGKGGSECANANHASSRFDSITPPLSPILAHHSHGLLHHMHSLNQDGSDTGSMLIVANVDGGPVAQLPERLFVYEFEIPQLLVGLLIGKMGAYVNLIKMQTGANLLVRDHNRRYKLCAVEGKFSSVLFIQV